MNIDISDLPSRIQIEVFAAYVVLLVLVIGFVLGERSLYLAAYGYAGVIVTSRMWEWAFD